MVYAGFGITGLSFSSMAGNSSASGQVNQIISTILENENRASAEQWFIQLKEEIEKEEFFGYNLSTQLNSGGLNRCFESEWCIPKNIERKYIPIRY